jgi:hypothetical protein
VDISSEWFNFIAQSSFSHRDYFRFLETTPVILTENHTPDTQNISTILVFENINVMLVHIWLNQLPCSQYHCFAVLSNAVTELHGPYECAIGNNWESRQCYERISSNVQCKNNSFVFPLRNIKFSLNFMFVIHIVINVHRAHNIKFKSTNWVLVGMNLA